MSLSLASRQPAGGRPELTVPREHGFWVMLAAVVFAAVVRHPGMASVLVACLVVATAALLGSLVRRQVRRRPRLQLLAALMLAAAGAPIELAARASRVDAAYDTAAWAAVFAAFTLSVWACTARSSRVRRRHVGALTAAAVAVPVSAALVLALAARAGHALAAVLGAAVSLVFAIWRPGAKQMKGIGLTLAGGAVLVALVLVML